MDDLDRTQDRIEAEEAGIIAAIRAQASRIPSGKAGDCDGCGEWSSRLVDGLCAPCRDRLGVG
jgi:hypothetical protein